MSFTWHPLTHTQTLGHTGLMRIFTATLAEHGVLEDYEPPRSKYAKKAIAAKKEEG